MPPLLPRWIDRSLAIALSAALSGCPASAPPRESTPCLPANALPVPILRQAHPYSCGAAVMQAVLFYWQVEDAGEAELYAALATTEEHGTHPAKLVVVARARGLAATLREGLQVADLEAALARGETVILDCQAWREEVKRTWAEEWEDGHYVVLVGLDGANLYLMDPSTPSGYAYVPIPEFVERWHDYECRDGPVRRYVHAGVFIRGTNALRSFPAPPQKMD